MRFFYPIKVLVLFVALGQLLFAVFSSFYTRPEFEGKIYATLGVEFFDKNDLHKLNEAAHYFGQTLIGWTKFPHFSPSLKEKASLPADTVFNAHMQERQNIIFSLNSKEPITSTHLSATQTFIGTQLDEYNQKAGTRFMLSNVDTGERELTRSYSSGSLFAFLLSVVLSFFIFYLRRIF